MLFSYYCFKKVAVKLSTAWNDALALSTLAMGALGLVTVSVSLHMTHVLCPLNRRCSSSARYWLPSRARRCQMIFSAISETREATFLRNLQILAIFLQMRCTRSALAYANKWDDWGPQAIAAQRGCTQLISSQALLASSGQAKEKDGDGTKSQLYAFENSQRCLALEWEHPGSTWKLLNYLEGYLVEDRLTQGTGEKGTQSVLRAGCHLGLL